MARLRAAAWLVRCSSWEFWPAWLVYAPLVPWIVALALRHRSLTVFTAANPTILHAGVVGESKWGILSRLPAEAVVPTELVPPGPSEARLASLRRSVSGRGWSFPLVLKPDVGERGAGVRLVRDFDQAAAYLDAHRAAVIAQTFHPGPCEAGIFYIRHPDEAHGHIFSITDKRFPVIVGDGRSSLRALIWRHPRFRTQARVYLHRLGAGASRVPALGERVAIGIAGNHCQGTMFVDGKRLITRELTESIDRAARRVEGFFFGRFDVRYADEAELRAGRGFQIVELNGVLSESTNIYDPSTGYWAAQKVLRAQWRAAFEIGAANRRRGHGVSSLGEVIGTALAHRSREDRDPQAD